MVKFIPVFILLTGCAATMTIPEADSNAAKSFVQNCSTCHALPHPKRHTQQEWEQMVNLMEWQRENRGMARTDEATHSQILGYLKRHAR